MGREGQVDTSWRSSAKLRGLIDIHSFRKPKRTRCIRVSLSARRFHCAPLDSRLRDSSELLRKLYPKHSLTMTNDYTLNILTYPGAFSVPLNEDEFITNLVFVPFARRLSYGLPGVLVNSVTYGGFKTAWDVSVFHFFEIFNRGFNVLLKQRYEFIVYVVKVCSVFSLVLVPNRKMTFCT